jgi:hypothetical protein
MKATEEIANTWKALPTPSIARFTLVLSENDARMAFETFSCLQNQSKQDSWRESLSSCNGDNLTTSF